MGLGFSVICHLRRPVHRTWHTEIVNKNLHLRVKVMSHRGEASVKRERKVCDFCPIITPLDCYIFFFCEEAAVGQLVTG